MTERPRVRAPARLTSTHAGELRGPLEVAIAAHVDVEQVRRDLRRGKIAAWRFSRVWLFDRDQYVGAVEYYRRKRREERDATKRTAS